MQEVTHVIQNNKIILNLSGYIEKKDAIARARQDDISGTLEIHHLVKEHKEFIPYAVYYISRENKTNGAICPLLFTPIRTGTT